MAPIPMIPDARDRSIRADEHPPKTSSRGTNATRDFRAAFEEHMPSSGKPISHDHVSVLLLSYEYSKDHRYSDMNVQPEVDELEDVFRRDYGFHVEQKIIKRSQNAHRQMIRHLNDLALDHGKEHGLIIVYYAGHGAHSRDRLREGNRFDLYPRNEYKKKPSHQDLVMWEKCEAMLHESEGDVLVIFDCCDAGALARRRAVGRGFEYIGACEEEKTTHGPGQYSFTAAMTWALKELKSGSPFRTDTLVAKIRQYQFFPTEQKPVLFPRWATMPEHIWISNRHNNITLSRSSSVPEFQDENCDYIDFRVTFSRPLHTEDAPNVALLMTPLVNNRELPLSARYVSFLDKGTCKPKKDAALLWTRARNRITLIRRMQSSGEGSALPSFSNQKRKRPEPELDDEDASPKKYAKATVIWDMDPTSQQPVTPTSVEQDCSSERTLDLRVDTAIRQAPRIVLSPAQLETSPLIEDRVETLLRELEKLKQDTSQQPEMQDLLQSQVQAVLFREHDD